MPDPGPARSVEPSTDLLHPCPRVLRGARAIVASMLMVMLLAAGGLAWEGQWFSALLVLLIMALTIAPVWFGRRAGIDLPIEFQLAAIGFMFATLFLGEALDYYQRLWWWDLLLHTASGALLGIVGFLLVDLLNRDDRTGTRLAPRFVALFAFCFSLALGALWEIFEFTMDASFGLDMQKAMLNDPSGLTDTMWDLIVDALGAALVCAIGGWYLARGRRSFIQDWIARFAALNPHRFDR